ncbi:MAG TPA: hypothetical protein VFL77_10730 [Solirubrobacterales bacterium]|nr:hypothetical protein [Solirubrobacterales bacterium]
MRPELRRLRGVPGVGRSVPSIIAAFALALVLALPATAEGASIKTPGGPVGTSPHVYEIFWGGNWNSEPAAALRAKLETMYSSMGNSAWLGVLTQYWEAAEPAKSSEPTSFSYVGSTVAHSSYTDSVHDGAAPSEVDQSKMVAEIRKAIEANGWPTPNPPASDQFVVFPGPGSTYTSTFLQENQSCAWHTYGFDGTDGQVVYDWIGYGRGAESAGESEGPYWYCHMPYAASHEFAEAATDPLIDAWGHGAEAEVADLCSFDHTELAGIEVTLLWDASRGTQGECVAGDASPPKAPPQIQTEAATSITQTGATINGTLIPHGLEVAYYYFKWGTSESYTNTTGRVSGGYLATNPPKQALSGLTPGTVYHFRLFAEAPDGIILRGKDLTFETVPLPPENTAVPLVLPTPPYQAVAATTNNGTWTHKPTSFTYQWQRCNGTGGECTAISGATSREYWPVEADVGHTLIVKVTAINAGGSGTATSMPSSRVQGPATYYSLPEGSKPRDITVGPDGNLWFTNQAKNSIGKITTSGAITEYSLPSGSEPYSITSGPGGEQALWFTENNATGKLGKITTSGAITEFTGPAEHYPHSITAGADGNLWFLQTQHVDKMTTTGAITEYLLPEQSFGNAIVKGPDGNIWFTNDVQRNSVGKITTSGALTEYALPQTSIPAGITVGPDGNIWVSEPGNGSVQAKIAKVTPTGTITQYPLGEGWPDPTDIAPGPEGENALWFTGGGNPLVGKISTTGAVNEYKFQVATGTPGAIVAGPDGNLWFSLLNGKIARLQPQQHPVVTTEAATGATTTGATLHGSVNPEGVETKYYFEYGPTASYGSVTPETSAGSGLNEVPVKAVLSGLLESSTYHFRVVATSSLGTFKGSDLTFSTIGHPTVETKPVTGLGQSEATLNGIVNPRGLETKYFFEYGKTTAYGSKTAEVGIGAGTANLEESAVLVGLEPSVTYHYRVVASNANGVTKGVDEEFHGLAWRFLEAPSPSGATNSYLQGVRCLSASFCMAVGYFVNASGVGSTLIEHWDGTSWAIEEPPAPKESKSGALRGIACYSVSACVAVGTFTNAAGFAVPLAERWNGTSWAVEEPPVLSGQTNGRYYAVSCTAADTCTAVGVYRDSTAHEPAMVANLNGLGWSVQELPIPKEGSNPEPKEISCTSATACMAAGSFTKSFGFRPVAWRWNGLSWTVQEPPVPGGAGQSHLEGVSCTSATSCFSAGWLDNSAGKFVPLAETWNGSSWSWKEGTVPATASAAYFYAVSCTSSTSCIAAGTFTNSSGIRMPLAEFGNGASWLVEEPPIASGATQNELKSVSCALSRTCMAVGSFYGTAKVHVPLTEQYR